MRHIILPCRLSRVYSTSWDSPVRGPAPIITFWFQRIRGVQKHPPPLSSDSCGPPKCGLPPAQAHQAFPGKPTTSSLTASRADRPAQGFSQNNLATTTTSTVVDYNLNFKLQCTTVSSQEKGRRCGEPQSLFLYETIVVEK